MGGKNFEIFKLWLAAVRMHYIIMWQCMSHDGENLHHLSGDSLSDTCDNYTVYTHQNCTLPSPVSNNGTNCGWYFARLLVNFLKSATLLRLRNSRSVSTMPRLCPMLLRCSLCCEVIHPASSSSLINVTLGSMRSSNFTPFALSLRIRAWSKGRTSPNLAPISEVQIAQSLAYYRRPIG